MPAVTTQANLQSYYLHETLHALRDLKLTLESIKKDKPGLSEMRVALATSERIRDLAMIHGFDGVEKIGEKIVSTLRKLIAGGAKADDQFWANLESAVLAIKQVAEVEDTLERQMTVESIGRDMEWHRQKVQNCAAQLSDELDNSQGQQIELAFNNVTKVTLPGLNDICKGQLTVVDEPLFDISEFDNVLSIADKPIVITPRNQTLDLFSPEK